MSNPPAFQFYASDYLSSSKVQRMTLEAEGAYIRLLAYNWQDGFIPADVGQLARMCKSSPRKMALLWDRHLRECFVPTVDDPDKLVNPRLEEVRNNLLEFKAERSQSGKTGAAQRWKDHKQTHGSANGSATEQPIAKNGSPSPSSSPSPSPTSKEGEIKPLATGVADAPKYPPEFEAFWKESTQRGSKVEAGREWGKLKPDGDLRIKIWQGMAAWMESEQWKDESKQPHICRWLKRRGWEELVPKSSIYRGNSDGTPQFETKGEALVRKQKEAGERARHALRGSTGDGSGPDDSHGTGVALRARLIRSD